MISGNGNNIVDGGDGLTRRTPEGGYITSTSVSIENARRFLYDEDDDLPMTGNPANTPLPSGAGSAFPPPPRRGGSTDLSKGGDHRRVNTCAAACLATCGTWKGYGSKRLLLLICGVGILLASVWVIVALVNSEEEHANYSRVNGIHAKVTAEGITSQSDLETVGTPQYHAVQWLANVDGAKLRANSPYLMQRYVLAVLFYSTSGTEEHVKPKGMWNSQTGWLSAAGLCIWEGVECEADPNGPRFDGDGVVTALNLTSYGLAGNLPSELKALNNLTRLDLSKNGLVGTLPKDLVSLQELKVLILRDNQLSGTIPTDYGLKFSNLRQLGLGVNKLHGGIPREVEHMVNLRALGLEHNELEGLIPELEDLSKLKQLYLEGNKLDGPFPSSVTKLTNLVDLNLSNNHLTGMLSPELEKLTGLEKLNLFQLNLWGTIPDNIFTHVTRLVELNLQGNELTGSIPTTIGNLQDIQTFILSNNKLTGPLPRQLGLLVDAVAIHIEGNSIHGSIPKTISALKDLQELRINHNELTGTIPPDIGSLHRLLEFHAETNMLDGSIPTEFGNLKAVKEIRLYSNKLTGIMPQEICVLKSDEALTYLGVDCANDVVKCDCCTKCF